MRQPPGFVVKGREHQVCRLRKSIYGLKQAARVWHMTITDILMSLGFEQCKADTCLYRKRLVGGDWLYLLIYVDDILVTCAHQEEITKIEDSLQEKLSISKLGDIHCFLGIRVTRNADGFFILDQSVFIRKLVKRFGMEGAKGSKYPLDPGYFKVMKVSRNLKDNIQYHKLIGSLLYLASNTRPDIAASVGILSRKVSSPTELDWNEAKRIVRYLIHTMDYGLNGLAEELKPKSRLWKVSATPIGPAIRAIASRAAVTCFA